MKESFFDISWAILNKDFTSSCVRLSNLVTGLLEQTSTWPGKNGLMLTVAYACSLSKNIWLIGSKYFPKVTVYIIDF